MAPIIGKAAIAYLPNERVVGISKLARVLHGYARRLQVQERLTAQVADCIWDHLEPQGVAVGGEGSDACTSARGAEGGTCRGDQREPQGVAVVVEASHACMSARGVNTPGVMMTTSRMMGVFRSDERSRREVRPLMGYGCGRWPPSRFWRGPAAGAGTRRCRSTSRSLPRR